MLLPPQDQLPIGDTGCAIYQEPNAIRFELKIKPKRCHEVDAPPKGTVLLIRVYDETKQYDITMAIGSSTSPC